MEPSCKTVVFFAIIIVLNAIKNVVVSHAGVIAGSVAGGAVVFVVIGVLIYRKCNKQVKESSDTRIQLISSQFREIDENEYCYCTLDYNDSLNTNTSITPPIDTTLSNDKVTNRSSNSAIQGGDFIFFQGDHQTMVREPMLTPESHPRINAPGTPIYNTTKPAHLSSDVYHIISYYKNPAFDSTYDHLPTNVKEEYGKTHVTNHNRCDASLTYEDMTTCSPGVDEKPDVASYKDTEPDQNNTNNKSPAQSANTSSETSSVIVSNIHQ